MIKSEIDLALGHCPNFASWHQRQTLYQESFVCVASTQQFKGRKRLIPIHVNGDTYEFCRDAKFRVSTGVYLYQGFCETV